VVIFGQALSTNSFVTLAIGRLLCSRLENKSTCQKTHGFEIKIFLASFRLTCRQPGSQRFGIITYVAMASDARFCIEITGWTLFLIFLSAPYENSKVIVTTRRAINRMKSSFSGFKFKA